ncbi:MAG: pyridoxine 5'-phosphate synthase [Oligoflexales bacterium]|nr:pyridoxine 5'-phosphate synthase [Oligoflexales bacterium]
MIRLGVNIDHVATVRNARGEVYPDPVHAAHFAELGGADNITCHLREDRRHIKDRDLTVLMETVKIPLNLEMAATDEMCSIAVKARPASVTLVPERRQELTTEGGLDVGSHKAALSKRIKQIRENGILVSLFIDPDLKMIEMSKEAGADAVEFHTGDFCHKMDRVKRTKDAHELVRPLIAAAETARGLGLQVHFGHGLHYNNAHWLQIVPYCEEANIGHAIISRAIFVGLTEAVREMKDLLNNPKYRPQVF